MALPQRLPIEWMRPVLGPFHYSSGQTRSDCSGMPPGTQVHPRKLSAIRVPNRIGKREIRPFDILGVVLKRNAIRHGREFVKHVVPAVVKPARVLWNEIIGFLFISFGVIFGFKTFTYFRDYGRTVAATGDATGDVIRLAMAGFCTLLMTYFGITSFRRARKLSRS